MNPELRFADVHTNILIVMKMGIKSMSFCEDGMFRLMRGKMFQGVDKKNPKLSVDRIWYIISEGGDNQCIRV